MCIQKFSCTLGWSGAAMFISSLIFDFMVSLLVSLRCSDNNSLRLAPCWARGERVCVQLFRHTCAVAIKNTLLLSRPSGKTRACVKCTPIAINTRGKLHFRINRKTVWNAQYKRQHTTHTLTTNSYAAIHSHKTEGRKILRTIVYTHSSTQLSFDN